MHTPVLTALIIIFIIWLQYEIRKSSRSRKEGSDNFWDKEYKSNLTRRKDITNLNYLTINTEHLPLEDKTDDTINSYRDIILQLSDKKLLNLSSFTNTELKNLYGVANINLLTEYDNNYTAFISILQKWAERLYIKGYISEALRVLEYGVSCKTEVSKSYKLLAEIYKEQNTPEKITPLLHTLETITIHDKNRLLQTLQDIMNS